MGSEERITDRILNMALESVFYDESSAETLINGILEEDKLDREKEAEEEKVRSQPPPIPEMEELHDKLDFEADENEKELKEEEDVTKQLNSVSNVNDEKNNTS